jgi:hypothetical protein
VEPEVVAVANYYFLNFFVSIFLPGNYVSKYFVSHKHVRYMSETLMFAIFCLLSKNESTVCL